MRAHDYEIKTERLLLRPMTVADKEALKLAIDFIKTSPSGRSEYCWLSYEPENEVARNLYLSFGFEEKKELWKEDQEIPAVYN